ncbi:MULTISPECIES: hypothetical protein [Streptomyces]|uniref:DNA-directed RNA polymerase specialized sigma24 family protein n=1 Tax=Streptomyces thermogriseus TaxID=75292 RepID=A0ABP4DHC2_9ACTN|nr:MULTISPECIES: hypothetical protein [Streptomyces]MDN5384128.1 hypothetical protein [Streptomyces sp. LB8]
MQSQDVAPRHSSSGPVVDVERAEAALVEHYPRLVRLAYLVLPPGLGRKRRVLSAHALVQRALPRGRSATGAPVLAGGREADPAYAFVRLQVLRTALEAGRPLRRTVWPKRAQLPPILPMVWGLRLFPRSGGADELALDQRLASLSGPARAAYVLRGLERLPDPAVHDLLTAAGVADPGAALRQADRVPGHYALLESPEFDPCSLQARPTDLMRRRQHSRAALAGVAALAVCGALVALPRGGWGPDGAAAPVYAQNPSAEAALDPAELTKVSPTAWRASSRPGFSVWPARGNLTGDMSLLRRALAVWARPGASVRVSATPGTPTGGPAGPPQLLYAGEVDQARVVIFHDGLRIARYAESKDSAEVALDFARVDGATGAEAAAVVLSRSDGNVRYLTAPWVTAAARRNLLDPGSEAVGLGPKDGVTRPLASPVQRTGPCTSWNALQLTDGSGTHLLGDLGELVPARLTSGDPAAPRETSDASARSTWAPFVCSLSAVRTQGVRSVNLWPYARQPLPDGSGTAEWVCTRAETWRGTGPRVMAQFRVPQGRHGTAVARAEDVSACGAHDPHVLAGVLWKSEAGLWYLLAAGTEDTASISATGDVRATAEGHLLAVRTRRGAEVDLAGKLDDGTSIGVLRQR